MPSTQTFGPYSPVRQAGDLYFVSGQVGVDPETKQVGKTIEEQASQALANIATVLTTVDLEMRDVVKTTIYLTDVGEFAALNTVYGGHFSQPYPARSTVGVKELPRVGGDTPIKVEIEVVAMRGTK